MPEEITKKERVLSVLTAIFKALFASAFILAEGFLVMFLGACMVFAVIIFPLRKPIHNAINKLSSNINKQYGRLLESIAYEGNKKTVIILSWIGILLLRVATIIFLGFWVLYFAVCFGTYSLFIPFLRQIVVDDVRGMYREIKNNFECIIAMISGGKDDDSEFLIGDERSRTRIIVGGIFKVPLRIGAIFADGFSVMTLCAFFFYTVWFKVLRDGTKDAIAELCKRIGVHLKFISYVFMNQYPDFEIEGEYIEERHLKKDGTPDRRYRENK
jgi:hypothetical protein